MPALPIIAIASTVAAGATSAYGAYQQGQAQKNLMNYQAQAAQVQAGQVAATAEANISGAQNQAALQATMLGRQQAIVAGSQKASAGAQGIGSSVTAANIATDTFTKQQMDQQTLQYNANVKAWNITNQANNQIWGLGIQENMDTMGAKNAASAGDISAGGDLLGSAAQVGTEGVLFGMNGNPSPNSGVSVSSS